MSEDLYLREAVWISSSSNILWEIKVTIYARSSIPYIIIKIHILSSDGQVV